MAQTILLMKSPGAAVVLRELQADGVLRASAAVRSGCYTALGFSNATPMSLTSSTLAEEGCNPPYNMDCTLAEYMEWLGKVSNIMPTASLSNISFALVTLASGKLGAYERHVIDVGGRGLGDGLQVKAGALFGCGTHHAILEVVASDVDTMLRRLQDLLDFEGVVDAQVLRVHPEDAHGFGPEEPPRALV